MSEPSWPEIIHGAIRNALDGVHTSIPAKVTSYLAPLQQCAVEPVISGMPALEDVPVLWPRGGGYFVHLPLAAGDWVLLTFCEQDFSPWRLSGSAQAPALLRRHGLFAFATPGAAPDISPLITPTTLTGAAIGKDGGICMQVGAADVQVGPAGVGALPVMTAAEFTTLMAGLATTVAALPTAPNDGGALLKTGLASALGLSAVGSTVLKVGS